MDLKAQLAEYATRQAGEQRVNRVISVQDFEIITLSSCDAT
jgi:hypothetical protein